MQHEVLAGNHRHAFADDAEEAQFRGVESIDVDGVDLVVGIEPHPVVAYLEGHEGQQGHGQPPTDGMGQEQQVEEQHHEHLCRQQSHHRPLDEEEGHGADDVGQQLAPRHCT